MLSPISAHYEKDMLNVGYGAMIFKSPLLTTIALCIRSAIEATDEITSFGTPCQILLSGVIHSTHPPLQLL